MNSPVSKKKKEKPTTYYSGELVAGELQARWIKYKNSLDRYCARYLNFLTIY